MVWTPERRNRVIEGLTVSNQYASRYLAEQNNSTLPDFDGRLTTILTLRVEKYLFVI